jgi:hypothetical protein
MMIIIIWEMIIDILNIRQTLLVFKMYFSVFYIKVVAL